MTFIRDLLDPAQPSFSFEFFPPKTDVGEANLFGAIAELEPLGPTFVSVTYGAGGSTSDRTLRVVQRIAAETALLPMAHLTCVGATVEEICEVVGELADAGVRNIMALRGDMPDGLGTPWRPTPGGLTHAADLVQLIHRCGDFCVGVAAFPEKHPESADLDTDAAHLAAKLRAGADFAVTNMFFSADDYVAMVDRVAAHGVDRPIIPGVMPVTDARQITRMAELSGATFPGDLAARLLAVEQDPEAVRAIGVEFATTLCRQLLDRGAPGIHFYTLNRSTATREVHANLTGS